MEKLTDFCQTEKSPATVVHNIIIFGEAGSGKSSPVNQIVGEPVAGVSNGASGCTFENNFYDVRIEDTDFRIYDTAGLNEGDQGRVPHWKAIQNLYTLIRQLDGLSLLIYCMRGRVKDNSKANWILFNKVICGEQVPIIAAVTGLETEANPDDWWQREENREAFRRHLMYPKDVACVVAVRFSDFEAKYMQSQANLRKLIMDSYRSLPWSTEKNIWFSSIYQTVYEAGICFFPRKRVDFVQEMRTVLFEFVSQTRMMEEDEEKLTAALRDAEKKILKGQGEKKPRRQIFGVALRRRETSS